MTLIHDRSAVEAPVLDAVAERWSTRIFDAEAPIDETALATALEAARWAPSASNTQPWRFIVARRGTPQHAAIVSTLMGFNVGWTPAAGALVVVLTERENAEGKPVIWGEYDAGQAAAFFILQAHASGLHTHTIGGFDRAALSTALEVDARLQPLSIIAVGDLGDYDTAPDELRARETNPRTRRPLSETVVIDA